MRVWITGATGLLGTYLQRTAPKGAEILTDRVEILSKSAIQSYVEKNAPDTIIHCAGDGRADMAQQDPEWAYRINVEATRNIFEHRGKAQHFVYISSNAVYSGEAPPYTEESGTLPVNEYGKSKLLAETTLKQHAHAGMEGRLTIIRPIFLFGWILPGRRLHFINRVLRSLELKQPVDVADDIFTQPTYAWDCAAAIWELLEKQTAKIDAFNIAPRRKMSLYEFAQEVAEVFRYPKDLIRPIKGDTLKSHAPRPKDTTYDPAKIFSLYGIRIPNARSGLERMKEDADAKGLGLLLY